MRSELDGHCVTRQRRRRVEGGGGRRCMATVMSWGVAAAGARLILSYLFGHYVCGGLPAPRNVSLYSKNFSLYLTWIPEEDHPELLYMVSTKHNDVWLPFLNCTNTSGEDCDVTCTIKNCYWDYQAKVESSLPGNPVAWSLSRNFNPFYEMELGAPQLKVVLKEESVLVHLKIKLTECKENVLKACLIDNLSYEVEFWNADAHVKRPIENSSTKNVLEIQNDQFHGSNICVSARSVYKSTLRRSNSSEPVCFKLKGKGLTTAMTLTMLGILLGSFLGMSVLIPLSVAKVRKQISVPARLKTPAALDFKRTITFTSMEDDQPVECSLLSVIHRDKGEEMNEQQKAALKTNVQQEMIETSVLNNLDYSSESDEENECSDYTENRWIPDGVMFDKDETVDNDFHQTSKTEPYQKANSFFTFSHVAIDMQSQSNSDSSNHDALQTTIYDDVASPSSVTSVVLNSKNFRDSIGLLEHCDKSSNGDIPLTSVKVLCCNGEMDDEDDDLLPYNHQNLIMI